MRGYNSWRIRMKFSRASLISSQGISPVNTKMNQNTKKRLNHRLGKNLGRGLGRMTLAVLLVCAGAVSANYEQAVELYNAGDIQAAHDTWLQQAEAGDPFSQYALGVLYHNGQLGTPDYTKAAQWFERAAEQDHLEAMHNLGIAYWEGRGVPQDYQKSYYWWRRGAVLDYPPAQFNLATMYYTGTGTDRDMSLAVAWFRRAAQNGHEEAINAVEVLKKEFPAPFAEDIAEVETPPAPAASDVPAEVVESEPAVTAKAMDPEPDAVTAADETAVPEPEAEIAADETAVAEPEAATAADEPAVAESEAATAADETAVAEPEAETAAGETTVGEMLAAAKVMEPEATPPAAESDMPGMIQVYAFPRDEAPSIGETLAGPGLNILGTSGGWARVLAPEGAVVWAYGRYIDSDTGVARVTTAGLRARPLPNTSSESIPVGSFQLGDVVEVVEMVGDWKRVKVQDRVAGWVKVEDIENSRRGTAAESTQVAAASAEGSTQAMESAAEPAPAMTPTTEPEQAMESAAETQAMAVESDDPNLIEVFAFPREGAPLIGQAEPTEAFNNILVRTGEWARIMSPQGVTVWTYGRYVDGDVGIARVTVDGLRARPFPSIGPESTPIGQLQAGDQVEVLELRGDWKRVKVKERVAGWVRTEDLAAQ